MPTPTASRRQVDEPRALGRLTFAELRRATAGIGDIHGAVAQRVFDAVGPIGAPVRAAHDTIAGGVYAAVRGVEGAIGWSADQVLDRRPVVDGREVSTSVAGSWGLGILNGLIGDALAAADDELAAPMSIRVGRRPVEPEPRALRRAYLAPTSRLVVFVHGLMGTELGWWINDGEARVSYGDRLAAELGATPLYLRYNTGRHISENGRSLAELLERVIAAWPGPVHEIALVGHSMGGLVARSAGHHARERRMAWVGRVRHVVSLGTPHLGAPLAQAVHWASAALAFVPETRPLAGLLRRRSDGIRDLRQGSLVDEDWRGVDPDALASVACREVPLLAGVTHCFVSATVTRSPRHPVGRMIGDTLVLEPSAAGRGRTRRIGFRAEHGAHVAPAHHMSLLNHPAVYVRLRHWLATRPPMLPRPGETGARPPAAPEPFAVRRLGGR